MTSLFEIDPCYRCYWRRWTVPCRIFGQIPKNVKETQECDRRIDERKKYEELPRILAEKEKGLFKG